VSWPFAGAGSDRARSGRGLRLLITRIVTAALFGAVLIATVLFLSTRAVAVVFGVLWLAGAWEWAGLARFDIGARVVYSGLFAVAMIAAWHEVDARIATLVLGVALLWWLVALGAVASFPRRFGRGLVATLGAVVLLPSWLAVTRVHAAAPHGAGLLMTLLAVVWAADVGAYFVGRWLGRTKLAPAVSPGKTWEGMAGGLLLAALAGGGGALWLGLAVPSFVALGVATGLVSVLGDLTQSMFKRNVGLKDSGRLLPGHGGVLDRIDSLTAAAPVYAAGLLLLRLVG
jgi:phosphatidate cytidylyltransferase